MESKHSLEQLGEIRKQLFKMELSVEEFKKFRDAKIDYDVTSIEKISSGGQASVFKIKCKIDQQFYAIKKFNKDFFYEHID